MDIAYIHSLFLTCSSVSIDTRRILTGSFFIAIKGERFDANAFAMDALEKGASYVVIDNADYLVDDRTILVGDSMILLQQLAKFHREYLKIPIIALTGSNGKTTTKELINVVLATKFRTKATLGNLNNHIGVPLTLLSFDSKTEIGIVEMGANHQKEISFLCGIAMPDYGYITNYGKAHLEGFGGVEGVIKGKSELYDYLLQYNKHAFVNLDDTIQVEKSKSLKNVTFGVNNKYADLNIEYVSANPFVHIKYANIAIDSHLIGLYNANNINAAIAIGRFFAVLDSDIKNAVESYIPANNRSQLLQNGTNAIILDAYNANPSSMEVAIENFLQLAKPEKMLILGDMFELGVESKDEHRTIVDRLSTEESILCNFVGEDFYLNKQDMKHMNFYKSYDDLATSLKQIKPENKTILIKGSRGMALERILEWL